MRSNSDPTAALLLCIAAGLWTFFKGFRVLRESKVLEDTPRIAVRSVSHGLCSRTRQGAESAEHAGRTPRLPAPTHLSLIGKGQHEPTFVISTGSNAELNSNLFRRAGLMMLGGAALAPVRLAGLFVHFHLF